jgi:hypothetical protein
MTLRSVQPEDNQGEALYGDGMMGIALRDRQIDEDEKRVLNNIFSRIKQENVGPKVWERIQAIREKHGI